MRDDLIMQNYENIHTRRAAPLQTNKIEKDDKIIYNVPPLKKYEVESDQLLQIESVLEGWAQTTFRGTESLNTIQSLVFESAYCSNENMLVCAPTGAGKTNIAMLAVLKTLKNAMNS